MDIITQLKSVIDEGNYRVLRTEPDHTGKTLSHVDTVRILDLSDGQAAVFKASFDAGIEINTNV